MDKRLILGLSMFIFVIFCAGFVSAAGAPAILQVTTLDNDSNGWIEGVKILFNTTIYDTSINRICWRVNGSDDRQDVASANISTGETANDAIIFLNFTPQQYTNTTPTLNYTSNATAGSSCRLIIEESANTGTDSMATNNSITTLDGAAPVFFSAKSYDVNNNGAIDRINVTMSENLTVGAINASLFRVRVTYGGTGNNGVGTAAPFTRLLKVSGVRVSPIRTEIFTINLTDTIIGTGNLSVIYTQPTSAQSGINDTKGNKTLTNASVPATDNASAVMLSKISLDRNKNGYLDAIQINFSEPINNNSINESAINFSIGCLDDDNCTNETNGVAAAGYGSVAINMLTQDLITIDSYNAFPGATEGINDSVIFLNFSSAKNTNFTTGVVVNMTYAIPNVSGAIQDMAGVNVTQNKTADNYTDGAPPAFWQQSKSYDLNSNGAINSINLSMSERLTATTGATGKRSLFTVRVTYGGTGNNGVGTAAPFTRQLTVAGVTITAGGNVTINLTDALIGTGNVTVSYTGAADGINGTGSIASAGWESYANADIGIYNYTISNATIRVTDNASAVMLSKITIDRNNNGFLDAIQINFSEPVKDDSLNNSNNWSIGCLGANDGVTTDSICINMSFINLDASNGFETGGGVNDSVVYLNITDDDAIANFTTGDVMNVTFSHNATSWLLDMGAVNGSSNESAHNASDGAQPVIRTAVAFDKNNNGAIDYINLTMSERLTATAGGTGKRSLFTAYVTYGGQGANGTADGPSSFKRQLTIAGVTLTGTDITLNLTDMAYGTGNVTISYTNDGVNLNSSGPGPSGYRTYVNEDLGFYNYTKSNATVRVTDNASAVILSKITLDNNHNGYLDAVQINFSEPIDNNSINNSNNWSIGCLGVNPATDCRNMSTLTLDPYSGFEGVNDSVLYLNFTITEDGNNFTTGDVMNVTFTPNATSSLLDIAGLNGTVNQTADNASDKAEPVILSKGTLDFNNNGYLDYINITFSEKINDSTCDGGNFTIQEISTWNYDATFAGDNTRNDTRVYLNFSTLGTFFTNGTPTVNYTRDGSGAYENCTDLAKNLLYTNQSSLAATDTAPPAMLSAYAYGDDVSGVSLNDYVVIEFSEAVNFSLGISASEGTGIFNNSVNGTLGGTPSSLIYTNGTPDTIFDIDNGTFNSQNTSLTIYFNNSNSNITASSSDPQYLLFMNSSWYDLRGNKVPNNGTNQTLKGSFYTAPAAGGAGGGGGGAGVGEGTSYSAELSATAPSTEVTSLQAQDSVSFTAAGGSHKIKVDAILYSSQRVKVTISSTPKTVYLKLNEPLEVDVNDDGVKDVKLTLTALTTKNADIKMELLAAKTEPTVPVVEVKKEAAVKEKEAAPAAEVPAEAEEELLPEEVVEAVEGEVELKESNAGKIVLGILALVVVVGLILYLAFSKKKQK